MESVITIPIIADHAALDFVNTSEERGHPEASDVLRTPGDLRLWGQRYDLVGRVDPDQAEFQKARDARELLYMILLARVHETPASKQQLQQLTELAAEAYGAAGLVTEKDSPLHWRWPRSELSTIRHTVVTSAVELLQTEPTDRLKQCPGDHCGWFFLDATKRGNRRWCSMSECGQDAKDARRRSQRRAKASG